MTSRSSKLHEEYFMEYTGHKKGTCEACGGGAGQRDEDGFLVRKSLGPKLTVHHIDGDVTNNKPENLQTLCRTCHDKVHGGTLPRYSA